MKVIVFTEDELQETIEKAVSKGIEKYIEIRKMDQETRSSYIDPDEWGKEINRHSVTIRRWIHQGIIPGYKIGGKIMIDREEANTLIKSKALKPRQFPAA